MKFQIPEYPPNWDEIRKEVLELDNYKCQNCGEKSKKLHIHHIIPLSKRGRNDAYNLVTLCEECHKTEHPNLDTSIKKRYGPTGVSYLSYLYCEKCNNKFSHETGLCFCPYCQIFLKTITLVEPPHGKYDYHHLKHGVEDDEQNEHHKDDEDWIEPPQSSI